MKGQKNKLSLILVFMIIFVSLWTFLINDSQTKNAILKYQELKEQSSFVQI